RRRRRRERCSLRVAHARSTVMPTVAVHGYAPRIATHSGGRSDVRAGRFDMNISALAARLATPAVHWIALFALCSASIQGGLTKLFDFAGAIAEMHHIGLTPATPFAIATIVLEFAAPLAILSGKYRWLGALALAGFTVMATFVANRF